MYCRCNIIEKTHTLIYELFVHDIFKTALHFDMLHHYAIKDVKSICIYFHGRDSILCECIGKPYTSEYHSSFRFSSASWKLFVPVEHIAPDETVYNYTDYIENNSMGGIRLFIS